MTRRYWWLVLVMLIGLPIAELWLLIQAGHRIGVWPTIGILVGVAALGTWLAQHEGLRTFRAVGESTRAGIPPTKEMLDGAIIMLGALLLVLPGFFSDVVALVCLLPFTRALPRRLLKRAVWAPTGVVVRTRRRPEQVVIPGEVVDDPVDADPAATHRHESTEEPDGDQPPALEGRIL